MLLSLLFLAANAASLPRRISSSYALKEAHNVPRTWTQLGPAPRDHMLDLQIGLKQSRFDELERHLLEISDPSHTRYTDYLSAEEVNDLVKPSDETFSSVLEWLASSGVGYESLSFSPAQDFIHVSLPVEMVETLLDTEYSIFEQDDHVIVRSSEWSLPRHLHNHIDTIQPTTNFMRPARQANTVIDADSTKSVQTFEASFGDASLGYPDTSSVCDPNSVNITCISTLYGTAGYKPKVPKKNKVSLTNYLGEVQARSDVKAFLAQYRPSAVSAASSFGNVVIAGGPPDPQKLNSTQFGSLTGIEGSLDAEYVLGLSYPVPLVTYSTGGLPPWQPDAGYQFNTNEPYATWLQHVLSQSDADLPYTVSSSYADDEDTVPKSYALKVCSLFAQLGARGVTAFVASGDYGVGVSGLCVSNDGKNRTVLVPTFPGSCPYVTAVGGTENFGPEQPAYDGLYSTGSGFSNYFARPSWQNTVVPAYIKSINGLYNGHYNKSGRAYPDLSATSMNFPIIWNGTSRSAEGTSASTPVVASIFTLLNDVRLAAGLKPLGFLNPFLYSTLHKGFHDVTNGSNPGCSELGGQPGQGLGFPAKKGWDSPSGWGTPDFTVLKSLVVNTTATT